MDIVQTFENLGWLANLAEFVGFFVLIIALVNTHILRTEQKADHKRIILLLEDQNSNRSHQLPGGILRKDFSRGEILGRLGMLPLKQGTRFKIEMINNPKFLQKIEDIYNQRDDAILTIKCTQDEYDQFVF